MTSSLNSPPCEPYDALRAELRRALETSLGREEKALVVAPCRVAGYHYYSNIGFFDGGEGDISLPGMRFDRAGGFVNIRLSRERLRQAVAALAQQDTDPPGEPGESSRLRALVALRRDEKTWGATAEQLAWLLVKGAAAAGDYDRELDAAFKEYFRQGPIDHDLVRATLVRRARRGARK